MREADIVYENPKAWVFRDVKRQCYTVFVIGTTHSTSDSSYTLDEDGLSIAKVRADYFAKRAKVRAFQLIT